MLDQPLRVAALHPSRRARLRAGEPVNAAEPVDGTGAVVAVAVEAGAGGSGEKPIDLAHLARFTFADRALEREILDLFSGQLPQLAAAIRAAAHPSAGRMAAHTLKGSAWAVGAQRLARAAEAAERASAETWEDALGDLDAAVLEAQSFIRTL